MNQTSILVIEDEIEVSEMIVDYLRECDFKVDASYNLMDAFKSLSEQKYDLIISDLDLGRETSKEVFTEVRDNSQGVNFQTPIIVHSGSARFELQDEFGQVLKEVFVKPTSLSVIVEKIQEILSTPKSEA